MTEDQTDNKSKGVLEVGTYELLRNRIVNHSEELKTKLDALNEERKNVFGTIEKSWKDENKGVWIISVSVSYIVTKLLCIKDLDTFL